MISFRYSSVYPIHWWWKYFFDERLKNHLIVRKQQQNSFWLTFVFGATRIHASVSRSMWQIGTATFWTTKARPGHNHVCYRPHPKDGGRYCFQFVCQSTLAGGGGTPSQVWLGGYPMGWGTPPDLRWSTLPDLGWGTPPPDLGWGTPPPNLGWGTPPRPGTGYPPPPSIASTCYGYAAGGMPLAFTQEDFLVFVYFRNPQKYDELISSCAAWFFSIKRDDANSMSSLYRVQVLEYTQRIVKTVFFSTKYDALIVWVVCIVSKWWNQDTYNCYLVWGQLFRWFSHGKVRDVPLLMALLYQSKYRHVTLSYNSMHTDYLHHT